MDEFLRLGSSGRNDSLHPFLAKREAPRRIKPADTRAQHVFFALEAHSNAGDLPHVCDVLLLPCRRWSTGTWERYTPDVQHCRTCPKVVHRWRKCLVQIAPPGCMCQRDVYCSCCCRIQPPRYKTASYLVFTVTKGFLWKLQHSRACKDTSRFAFYAVHLILIEWETFSGTAKCVSTSNERCTTILLIFLFFVLPSPVSNVDESRTLCYSHLYPQFGVVRKRCFTESAPTPTTRRLHFFATRLSSPARCRQSRKLPQLCAGNPHGDQ